jgi:hypothetical protein
MSASMEETDEFRWGEAIDRAVADKAVAVYFSLPRLLGQLPVDIRGEVEAEMLAFGAPPPTSWYCLARIQSASFPDGTWRTWRRADRPDVFFFLISVTQDEYEAAIQQIANGLKSQRTMSAFN